MDNIHPLSFFAVILAVLSLMILYGVFCYYYFTDKEFWARRPYVNSLLLLVPIFKHFHGSVRWVFLFAALGVWLGLVAAFYFSKDIIHPSFVFLSSWILCGHIAETLNRYYCKTDKEYRAWSFSSLVRLSRRHVMYVFPIFKYYHGSARWILLTATLGSWFSFGAAVYFAGV